MLNNLKCSNSLIAMANLLVQCAVISCCWFGNVGACEVIGENFGSHKKIRNKKRNRKSKKKKERKENKKEKEDEKGEEEKKRKKEMLLKCDGLLTICFVLVPCVFKKSSICPG